MLYASYEKQSGRTITKMKEKIPLKYECLDRLGEVIKKCSDDDAVQLLKEMFDLIVYQMNEIKNQRIEIVSMKHQRSWKHHEKKDLTTVDNPPKSDKMIC